MWNRSTAVREGPWKLVVNGADDHNLANLDSDPGERANLAAASPRVMDRLLALRSRWVEQLLADPAVQRWGRGA